jgi:Holliday junction resolvasome RuvABC DNA-binding subunit
MEPGEAGPADSQSLELESALQSLGFNLKDIRRELSIMKADGVELPLEQMIKETIKRLYQRMK